MNLSMLSSSRWRIAQLSSHLVVALIALIVVGGATRVMEAGLACPDWPLCFGSFLPGRQMNIQVFLEWFHRLDAFLVGIGLLVQFVLSIVWRNDLPKWLPWTCFSLVLLLLFQGGLGALTVLQLLPSDVVTAHLAIALTLLALMSGLSQLLLAENTEKCLRWWRGLGLFSLLSVISQSLIGGHMASSWAVQKCIGQGQSCEILDLHKASAVLVSICVLAFSITSFFLGGWYRRQWPLILSSISLVITQIFLGVLTVRLGLDLPLVTISHQLVASLLVAVLAALAIRQRPKEVTPEISQALDHSSLEPCHG